RPENEVEDGRSPSTRARRASRAATGWIAHDGRGAGVRNASGPAPGSARDGRCDRRRGARDVGKTRRSPRGPSTIGALPECRLAGSWLDFDEGAKVGLTLPAGSSRARGEKILPAHGIATRRRANESTRSPGYQKRGLRGVPI